MIFSSICNNIIYNVGIIIDNQFYLNINNALHSKGK